MFLAPAPENIRKIKVLAPGSPMGGPKGIRAALGTPIPGLKTLKMFQNGSQCLVRYSHYIDPTGSAEPLGCLPRSKIAKNGPLGPLRAPKGPKGPRALCSPYEPFKAVIPDQPPTVAICSVVL